MVKSARHCFTFLLLCKGVLVRNIVAARILKRRSALKIYYGCGDIAQNGYVNIDIRYTRTVDIIADLEWCSRIFKGRCHEVYVSHVLEHYGYPGRDKRKGNQSVLSALSSIYQMLRPEGIIRVAVPDFAQICFLYYNKIMPLYPRLSGRLCGEQDYKENIHRCVFDRQFLEQCLSETGFVNIQEWDVSLSALKKDSSFDSLEGLRTSLNVMAEKPAQ